MAGLFDDLMPSTSTSGGLFDDLVPAKREDEASSWWDTAKNVAAGVGERIGDATGGLVRGVAGIAEAGGDFMDKNVGTLVKDKDGYTWRRLTEEEAAQPSSVTTLGNKAAGASEAIDFGYEPGTTWEQVKGSPLKNFIPFAIEQGLVSTPDMVAAVAALPAYVVARTGELGQERAQNDGVGNARVEDLIKVLPAAAASALLERLGAKGMFGLDEAVGGIVKRGVKAGVKEAGTEAAQEAGEYAATTVGTEKGFDPAEMADRAAAGAVAGGVYGAAAGSVTAGGEKIFKRGDEVVFNDGPAGEEAAGPYHGKKAKVGESFTDANGQTRYEVTFEDGQKAFPTEELLVKPERPTLAGDAPTAAPGNLFGDLVPADKPATVTPTQREEMVAPPPTVDRERLDSPRLTPADRASPIPNDIIDDGKALIERAIAGERLAPATSEPLSTGKAENPTPEVSGPPSASPIERAILRKAGSADDEIDVMSREERAADMKQAMDAGVSANAQDVAAAETYARPVARPAANPPLSAANPQPSAGAPQEVRSDPQLSAGPQAEASEPAVSAQVERSPIARRDMERDTAVTSAGRQVPVQYAVVEAKSLLASQTDEGRANADYPAELQPRDRSRGVSQTQIQSISSNINPRLLDKSPRASDGAPIVAADGTVESGNGRVLALRKAYSEGGAEGYRQHLASQGYPVDGMSEPVLVRVREGQMAPADRQAFTREANERDTLAMSSTEQAMADATAMSDGVLSLYRGGDIDAASNREFVRAYIRDVVGQNDQARMIGADGALSQEAVRRVQTGLLGKAYADPDLVASLSESTETNIKAIGGAMTDVSAEWAQMRSEAAAGRISKGADQSAGLIEAVRVVERARKEGMKVADLVNQRDIFTGKTVSPVAEGFLRLMYRNQNSWTQPVSRERLAEALRYYVTEARKTSEGVDLLGETAPTPDKILAKAKERQDGPETARTQEGLALRSPRNDAAREDVRPSGGDRAVTTERGQPAKGRDEGARGGDKPAGEVGDKPAASLREKPTAYHIRETVGDVTTEFVLTDKFRDQADALTDKLRAALDKAGLKDVGLRVSESIRMIVDGKAAEADGRYFRKTIDIALDAADPISTLNHESIHALRRLGLFSTSEWSILSSKSKREWVKRYNIEDRYEGFPDWAQVEEGIAHAYADWAKGEKTSSLVGRVFERMQTFVEALRNALKGMGFKSADSIFEQVSEGETGERSRDQFGRFQEQAFSLAERTGGIADQQKIPRVNAVTASLGNRIMQTIKRGKNDGESVGDYTHRMLIDYLQPLKVMIETAGGAPQDTMDAYLQARLAEDASLARIQSIHDNHVTPMIDVLAKAGATLEDLHRYAYALHAEERNRVVGLRNEPDSDFYKAVTDPSIKGASGWSTNEAKAALRELQQDKSKFAGLMKARTYLRAIVDQNLLDQKKAGLISAETFDSLTQQWQNYVPLRNEEADGDGLPGRGRGFDVRGNEFKAATGRYSEAENVVAWTIAAAERTQLRAGKNAVGKAMLRFINHVDPKGETIAKVYWSGDEGFGDIEKAPTVYRRELDKDGKVVNRKVPPSTISPDMFSAKVGGKSFYIKFADEKVGLALKKMGQSDMNMVFRILRKASVWQSIINTRLNPVFAPINILRDAQAATVHMLDDKFGAAGTAKALASVPQAWGALWRNTRGKKGDSEWDKVAAEYKASGGKISFDSNFNSIEDSLKALRKQVAAASRKKGGIVQTWKAFTKLVGDLNDTAENGIRLAAFKAARDKGMTPQRAAFLARDLTVDFKKHGEYGPSMNAYSAFFNASIQGSYNVGKRVLLSKTARRVAGGLILQGILVDMMNRAFSGDDDDGESYYSKLVRNEGYKLERQVVLFYGSGKGDYVSFPLPYGYNALYHLGLQIGATANGDVDPLEAIGNAARVTFDAYNPLGSGGSVVTMLSPTLVDPLIELGENRNFAGAPITPTRYPGDFEPDSQKKFSTNPEIMQMLAEGLNAATGGNDIEPGMIDVSPETIEHLWNYVSGGIGRFIGQSVDTAGKLATGEEIEPGSVPFARSFMGEVGDDSKRGEYYRQREQVQAAKDYLKAYQERGDQEGLAEFIDRNKVAVDSIGAFDGAEKGLRKIRKGKRAIEGDDSLSAADKKERLKPLEDAELSLMTQARLAYARARKASAE